MYILKRKCGICKKEKDLTKDNFHSDKTRPLGYMYNCKPCEKDRTRNKYLRNPRTDRYSLMTEEEKSKKHAIGRIYCRTPKGKSIGLANAYRKFDRIRNFENNVTQYNIVEILGTPCFYCGYPSTGFDRIDNQKGHTLENCLPACMECNVARMDNFTHEEMKIIGLAIKQVKDNRI